MMSYHIVVKLHHEVTFLFPFHSWLQLSYDSNVVFSHAHLCQFKLDRKFCFSGNKRCICVCPCFTYLFFLGKRDAVIASPWFLRCALLYLSVIFCAWATGSVWRHFILQESFLQLQSACCRFAFCSLVVGNSQTSNVPRCILCFIFVSSLFSTPVLATVGSWRKSVTRWSLQSLCYLYHLPSWDFRDGPLSCVITPRCGTSARLHSVCPWLIPDFFSPISHCLWQNWTHWA